jgi:hypothetical protein
MRAAEDDSGFADVQEKLAETVSKLAATVDPNQRRLLLREMRRLLAGADRILDSRPTKNR